MSHSSGAAFLKEIENGSRQASDDLDVSLVGSLPVGLGICLGGTTQRRYTIVAGQSKTKEDLVQKSHRAYNTLEATTAGLVYGLHQQQDEAPSDEALLSGWLHKTSRPKWTDKMTRAPHEHRQHRKFKLTEHSLEHSHLLQKVCIAKRPTGPAPYNYVMIITTRSCNKINAV